MFIELISRISLLVACVSCAAVSSYAQLDGKIVGGFVIDIQQAPWQVSFQRRGGHICGGSIIASNWIATAGHCVNGNSNDLTGLKFRAGSSFHGKGGEFLTIKQIIQHENYNRSKTDYDFALVELKHPIQLDETKQVIKLHNFDEVFSYNTMVFVSGWGNTHNLSESREQLRAAEVPLVNQKKCQLAYKTHEITPRMICAGFYEEGGKDSCQGDSGGPLVAHLDGEPRLIGIVSWGRGCAEPKFPGVYSRVIAVRDWINFHTGI